MKFLVTLVCLCSVAFQHGESHLIFDNNSFLLYNKQYPNSRLTRFANDGSLGMFDGGIYPNQFWTLKPHPTKTGYFHMVNSFAPVNYMYKYSGCDLCAYDTIEGDQYPDQLWKLVSSGDNDGYYYIYHKLYNNARITKFHGDYTNLGTYEGALYPDQLWRFLPRYTAQIVTLNLLEVDNRDGNTTTSKLLTVKAGLQTSNKVDRVFQDSVHAALFAAVLQLDSASQREILDYFEVSIPENGADRYRFESKTVQIDATRGKNVRVLQHVVMFQSSLPDDDCKLYGRVKVWYSQDGNFSDENRFNINQL